MTDENSTGRRLPVWLVVAVVLVSLGAGGWLLWKLWIGDKWGQPEIVGTGDPPETYYATRRAQQRGADQPRGPRWARGEDGVSNIGQGSWGIKSGDAAVEIRKEADEKLDYRFFYLRGDVIEADDLAALVARRRLVADQAMAESQKLSAEQIEKLKKIAGAPGMFVEAADRTKFQTLWDTYQMAGTDDDAARNDASTKLIKLLAEIGETAFAPTRETAKRRAGEVRAILTPEQIKSVEQLQQPQQTQATTQPQR